jgi:hypothetical protein
MESRISECFGNSILHARYRFALGRSAFDLSQNSGTIAKTKAIVPRRSGRRAFLKEQGCGLHSGFLKRAAMAVQNRGQAAAFQPKFYVLGTAHSS